MIPDPAASWLALAFVLLLVALFGCWLALAPKGGWRRQSPAPVEQTTNRKPDTTLARLVWSAHVAAQEHDLAVLTGEPEEMQTALLAVIRTNNDLETYLWSRRKEKERSDDNEPTE